MATTAQSSKGLLLATMEPPANIEEEFQDWYDSEHFLTDVDVLHGPAYGAIAISRYSPWTHRIMSKVWGQYRAEGVQVFPGASLLGQSGPCARLVLWRFRGVPAMLESLLANLRWADLRLKTTSLDARCVIEEALLAAHAGKTLATPLPSA